MVASPARETKMAGTNRYQSTYILSLNLAIDSVIGENFCSGESVCKYRSQLDFFCRF